MQHTSISTIPDLDKYLSEFVSTYVKGDFCVFDTETTNLRYDATLIIISLYNGVIPPAAIFVENGFFVGVPIAYIRKKFAELFNTLKSWAAHNGKYDLWVFSNNEIPLPNLVHDTLLLIQMADTELLKQLEYRVAQDFMYDKPKFTKIVGKSWDKIDWYVDTLPYVKKNEIFPARINKDVFGEYAAEDAYWTYRLLKKYLPIVQADTRSLKIYNEIEMPLIHVLLDMQLKGVRIDLAYISKIDTELSGEIDNLRNGIYEFCECEFNINSGKQLAEILYDKFSYPVFALTDKGQRSTDAATLYLLADKGYEVAIMLMNYSALFKLRSGYTQSIPKLMDYDGRLRGSINSAGTKTGRASSNSPNLQNMPTSTEFPIRRAFVPAVGKRFVIFDLSQIEPRLLAEASQDATLIKNYIDGGDIYQGIANDLLITRSQAKTVVLAIMYGLSHISLAQRLAIPVAEGEGIISAFYIKYPDVLKWKTRTEINALAKKESRTLFGRKRTIVAGIQNLNINALKRRAVNSMIQGSAADLMKIMMLRISEYLMPIRGASMLLQVHDEIVIECFDYDAEKIAIDVKHIVENVIKISVPLVCEMKICDNWLDMKVSPIKKAVQEQQVMMPFFNLLLNV